MTAYFEDLERDLVAAARRRGRARRVAGTLQRRRGFGGTLVVALAVTATATGAAAGTFTVLRGSPIPGPIAADAGPDQQVAPGTSRLAAVRAADPAAGSPWTIRLASSPSGLTCTTVGQERGASFGLVGLDGRFRRYAEGVIDGCGDTSAGPIVGARVFDADRRADVRTVVYGVAGDGLERVRVRTATGGRALPVGPGGTFLAAFRGYPEELGLSATLTLPGGPRTIPLGISKEIIPDGAGGPAWRADGFGISRVPGGCVQLRPAREREDPPVSPSACGSGGSPTLGQAPGTFFAVRRIKPTGCGRFSFARGRWCRTAPRTAVWGHLADSVRSARVEGSPGGPIVVAIGRARTFGVVLPARVNPAALTVVLSAKDGSITRKRGDTNLTDPPKEP